MSAQEQRPGTSIPHFDRIANAIRSGRCIPFLGAGVSATYRDWRNGQSEVPGSPTGWELKEILESALQAKPHAKRELGRARLIDLPSVAEFYIYFENGHRADIESRVREAIESAQSPRPIHWVLASIPSIRCVYTTNYDQLVEQACLQAQPRRRLIGPFVHDQSRVVQASPDSLPPDMLANRSFCWEAPKPSDGYPLLLYKMHGCVTQPNSLLITTYDYVHYIVTWQDERHGMPKTFRDLLLKNTILFLGYGLGDWNFRVIWEAMITAFPNGRFPIQSYAIKDKVTEFERSLFAQRNIAIIDCDLTLFARALADEFACPIPVPPRGNCDKAQGGRP